MGITLGYYKLTLLTVAQEMLPNKTWTRWNDIVIAKILYQPAILWEYLKDQVNNNKLNMTLEKPRRG